MSTISLVVGKYDREIFREGQSEPSVSFFFIREGNLAKNFGPFAESRGTRQHAFNKNNITSYLMVCTLCTP
ncbi:hypothetical protein RchiOBHm_Chr5g0076861 [Rosa chinensis]|uniref:Uncharacterized protein n=1 Tax=Rosa chinensis TaxID=74649 RepID=A0A2P6QLV9_ROSCH|nr:hypothetical protein RchiOBHm_Chr5g0076861 [Rosa chinensis]